MKATPPERFPNLNLKDAYAGLCELGGCEEPVHTITYNEIWLLCNPHSGTWIVFDDSLKGK